MNPKSEPVESHSLSSVVTDCISIPLTRTCLEENGKETISYLSAGITPIQRHWLDHGLCKLVTERCIAVFSPLL